MKYRMLCGVLLFVSCSHAQDDSAAVNSASLRPVPQTDEIEAGVDVLKQVYKSEYRRANDKNKDLARLNSVTLAKKLISTANETSPDSNGYFPMLSEVIRLGTTANRSELAFEAIAMLKKSHAVNASALQLAVFKKFTSRTVRVSEVKKCSLSLLSAIQNAANTQRIETALEMVEAGDSIGKRLFDSRLKSTLAQAREILEILLQQEEAVEAARKKLELVPNDPNANLVIAKFIGLRKGKWEEAEIYASQVDEDEIRSLFIREIGGPTDADQILALANDWWAFAATQTGADKLQATELAAMHYSSIVKDLKGFDQKQVETRLKGTTREHVIDVRMPLQAGPSTTSNGPPLPPELSSAPFEHDFATDLQKAWAKHIGLPVQFQNSAGMDFMLVPAGDFMMGASDSERLSPAESTAFKPQHPVRISKPFYIGTRVVTQDQYLRVIGSNPSKVKGSNRPVTNVCWDDANSFISKLPAVRKFRGKYRLPTEAEWEYSNRAGTQSRYFFGSDSSEVIQFCRKIGVQPGRDELQNSWGLFYETQGLGRAELPGMWEWPLDARRVYEQTDSTLVDPIGALDRSPRGLRRLSSYFRGNNLPQHGGRVGPAHDLSFRVVIELQ